MDAMNLARRAEAEQAAEGLGRTTFYPRLFVGQMALELYHAEMMRLPETIQDHLLDDDLGRLRHRRYLAVRWILLEGRNPLSDLHLR